jgi:hypothetical protein
MCSLSLIRVRHAAILALAIAALGCGRDYRPKEPVVAVGPLLSATAYRANVNAPPITLAVWLHTTGIAKAQLRGARLVSPSSPLCADGLAFDRLERDGSAEIEGPIAIDATHDLLVQFEGSEVQKRCRVHWRSMGTWAARRGLTKNPAWPNRALSCSHRPPR